MTVGFDELIRDHRIEDLHRLYSLCKRVDGLETLRIALNTYIKDTGRDLVNDKEKDKTMVESLLEYKKQIDEIFAKAFDLDEEFRYSIKEAFESFINTRANKPAEFLGMTAT